MTLLFLEDIATSEVLIIIVLIIILFGPKKIPEIARGLGRGVRIMREATDDIKREILKETDDINPIQSIKEELQSTKKSLLDSTEEIKKVSDSVEEHIGSVKR